MHIHLILSFVGSIKYIDYNARSILYCDLEGAASDHDLLELADKAKMLMKLGARNKLFVLYNFNEIVFTRQVLVHMNQLLANADSVERRIIFGVHPQYKLVMDKLIQLLHLDRNTLFAKSYNDAINTLTNDKLWAQERRHTNLPVTDEKRAPLPVYTEKEFTDMGLGEDKGENK